MQDNTRTRAATHDDDIHKLISDADTDAFVDDAGMEEYTDSFFASTFRQESAETRVVATPIVTMKTFDIAVPNSTAVVSNSNEHVRLVRAEVDGLRNENNAIRLQIESILIAQNHTYSAITAQNNTLTKKLCHLKQSQEVLAAKTIELSKQLMSHNSDRNDQRRMSIVSLGSDPVVASCVFRPVRNHHAAIIPFNPTRLQPQKRVRATDHDDPRESKKRKLL